MDKTLVLIPAYNEEEALAAFLAELKATFPTGHALVISDGSKDQTAAVAKAHGASVLDIPCNLGVGGAVQTGFQYALNKGYNELVRCDADGQHPPEEIPKLLKALHERSLDMVVGSRYLGLRSYTSDLHRYIGIRCLALALSFVCRTWVTDPTSGFYALKRPLLDLFARSYPTEYPEPEALALLRRQGYCFGEEPVRFRPRTLGTSTITKWGTLYYAFKVGLALLIDRARPLNPALTKRALGKAL